MADIYLNNERFSQADVSVGMLGRTVTGVTAINYTEEQEVTDEYVVGNREPAGFVRGNAKYSGDIELLADEFFGLTAAAGGWKKLPPFDITVTYNKGAVIIKETLKGVVIKSAPRQVASSNSAGLRLQCMLRIGNVVTTP